MYMFVQMTHLGLFQGELTRQPILEFVLSKHTLPALDDTFICASFFSKFKPLWLFSQT